MKNATFLILGAAFLLFCLFTQMGPRAMKAFAHPQDDYLETEKSKYTQLSDYTLDPSASVVYEKRHHDNTTLKTIREMMTNRSTVTPNCGTFGCCENLPGVAKTNAEGSNCNGFCSYTDTTDRTPTSGSTPSNYASVIKTDASLQPAPNSNPFPSPVLQALPPMPPLPVQPYHAAAETVFIRPPKSRNGSSASRGGKCGTCPEPTPCPPCARCPEPAFDCKKVPNYKSSNSEVLPMPILTDFSSFGM